MNPKKRRDSDVLRLMARIRKAVDRGADTAESIHKKVARLPLAPFEGVEPLEAALKDVRRMQDRSIRAVYDLVRDINHELVRLVEESITAAERQARRAAPRKAPRVSAARKAA
jgi:uncharacterized NAD-dependent epimerase/dehydratase family protein